MRRSRKIPEGQEQLPFKSAARRGIFSYAFLWERRLVSVLGASFLVFVLLYVYFVMASIVHVVARQELAAKVVVTKAAVSKLETRYLSETERVTESYARSIGFVAASHKIFVERGRAVTLHDAP
ncbi:MAG: hypothetical protein Q7R74_01445 [bacterium]|nr:hypothetical protein [bacterium]